MSDKGIKFLCELLGCATIRGHAGLPCSVVVSFPSHEQAEKFASLLLVFKLKSEEANNGD